MLLRSSEVHHALLRMLKRRVDVVVDAIDDRPLVDDQLVELLVDH